MRIAARMLGRETDRAQQLDGARQPLAATHQPLDLQRLGGAHAGVSCRKQAERWPGPTVASAGSRSRQIGIACGQRGAKPQPWAWAKGEGTTPSIAVSRLASQLVSDGIEFMRPRV